MPCQYFRLVKKETREAGGGLAHAHKTHVLSGCMKGHNWHNIDWERCRNLEWDAPCWWEQEQGYSTQDE